MKKISGVPVLIDGYWHVKWQYQNGSFQTTPFGWKHKEQAEQHIFFGLKEYK